MLWFKKKEVKEKIEWEFNTLEEAYVYIEQLHVRTKYLLNIIDAYEDDAWDIQIQLMNKIKDRQQPTYTKQEVLNLITNT